MSVSPLVYLLVGLAYTEHFQAIFMKPGRIVEYCYRKTH